MPNTLSKLFEMFVLNALKRHAKQSDPKLHKRIRSLSALSALLPPLNNQLDALSIMAYQRLLAGKLVFLEKELQSAFPDCPDSVLESNLLGLMTAVKSYSDTGEETNYQFMHLNLQEFLAARHAAANLSAEEQTTFIRKYLQDCHIRMMLLLLAGTSQLKGTDVKAIFTSEPLGFQQYQHPIHIARSDRGGISIPVIGEYEFVSRSGRGGLSIQAIDEYEPVTPSGLSVPRATEVTGDHIQHQPVDPGHIYTHTKKKKQFYSHSKVLQRFLLFLHLIHESQRAGLYKILLNAMPNPNKLYFSFYRLTPSGCIVLSHFLLATGHSWELLHFHFCGLTAHSIEAFLRACSDHTNTTVKQVRISYNSSSALTRLSLLSKISWLKHSKRLDLQGIQYPPGTPPDQIQLHSLLDLESLSDLELQVERIPESHVSDYSVVLNKFMAEVVHKRKLRKLKYTGPYPPHCETTLARLFEHRMSADAPLQQLELTLFGLGKVHVETRRWHADDCFLFMLEVGDKPRAEECQQFFKALNECHIEHQQLLVKGLTNTTTDQFTARLVENNSVKTLDISGNNIRSAGTEAIFRSLEHNTSLEELGMTWNRLTEGDSEAMGCAVERMLTVNTTLKVLELRRCGVTDTVVKSMAACRTGREQVSEDIRH